MIATERRRPSAVRSLALVALSLSSSSLGAACTFPNVTFETGDATAGDSAADGAGDAIEPDGRDAEGQDSGNDAVSPVDSGVDASVDTGMPPMDSGGLIDGPDCNCAASQMYPTTVTCTSLAGIGCAGEGFMGAVTCGTQAEYYMCLGSLLNCGAMPVGSKTQQCK
jgi:hypothetical protein